ncbi:MAG TPA: ABC transporter ATP-binding protein [Candidatus Saccharimonadales bacterium]|nr:ABC transporter ATP-binding protein [Candidatus Saccharimonadales bacterium]
MNRRQDPPVLEVQNLWQRFGGVAALSDVSFSIAAEERVGVIGPNGAGKTTLLNCLMSSPGPHRGRVVFCGRDITNMATHLLVRMGISRSFQLVNIFQSLTVLQNMMLALGGRTPLFPFRALRRFDSDRELRAQAHDALMAVGLAERAQLPARSLAYGEQRRLDLLMALQGAPRLVLLDEPSAGLTREERGKALDLVRAHSQASVLIIDHDLDTVYGIADRIIGLHQGRVIEEGTSAEIQESEVLRRAYFGTVEG